MNELYILCVIDNIRIEWHMINYTILNTTILLEKYFKNYLYNEKVEIEYDGENIKKYILENIVEKNPYRLCVNVYLDI